MSKAKKLAGKVGKAVKAVRESLDDKIRRLIREDREENTKDAAGAASSRSAHDDPFSLEAPMTDSEREAYAPVLQDYGLRKEVGMSDDLAEVMAKLNRGMDPTPLDYHFPTPQSYFYAEGAQEAFPGFRDVFLVQVKNGASVSRAYEAACTELGLPPLKKSNAMDRVLAELPEKPYGAFRLSAGEVAERFGGPALLGPQPNDVPRGDVHGSLGGAKLPDE